MAATVPAPGSATDAISYADLYARWERGNWSATEIDFSQDLVDWNEKLTPEQRRGALWMYTLFFHGEDSVADNLSPYVDAAPTEEQTYFLTTQQVDEARHAVFFNRFFNEVIKVGDGTPGGTMAATKDQITWGHRMVFERLDRMADELRKDRSRRKLASAVTLYHLIVEASLAQPGQHMIERYLEEMDLLPGFRAGMRNVALDEQRHIGFGVKLLSDFYKDDPEGTQEAIVSTIREVLPWTAAVIKPPNWDMSYLECFGFSLEDIGEEGARSLEHKLRAIGLPIDDIPGFPMDMTVGPRERAANGMTLLKANFIGNERPVTHDPAAIEVLFGQIARQADPRGVRPGTTIEWDFADAEPWHVVLDNGSTRAVRGRAGDADLTFRCRLDDWADLMSGREHPAKLMLLRRIRPKGDPRLLLKLPRVFG